jgi:hypothetical protein
MTLFVWSCKDQGQPKKGLAFSRAYLAARKRNTRKVLEIPQSLMDRNGVSDRLEGSLADGKQEWQFPEHALGAFQLMGGENHCCRNLPLQEDVRVQKTRISVPSRF